MKRAPKPRSSNCKLGKTCKTHPRHSTATADQSLPFLAKSSSEKAHALTLYNFLDYDEACRKLSRFSFMEMGTQQIIAASDVLHVPSLKIVRKINVWEKKSNSIRFERARFRSVSESKLYQASTTSWLWRAATSKAKIIMKLGLNACRITALRALEETIRTYVN